MDQVVFDDGDVLPLFITPKNGQDSAEFLTKWIQENQELLRKKMLEHGIVK